ncbi:hypothetical protein NFC81_15905 [Salinispirillum sp. LH 10-3-1]|uniref:AMP-binding enzyme C-terminal domain-containing protein n=1 Tax=Salinispirillum sp. LH 10-3-1 TaxID=2952525 RepID=A0AB38YFR3_9GAMM
MNGLELRQTDLLAVLKALLADELKSLRRGQDIVPDDWDQHTVVRSAPADFPHLSLQADSLERFALATRVADFFQIRESGLEDYLLRYNTLGEWTELITEARVRGTRNLSFTTSGSTGEPTTCAQDWHDLVSEIEFFRTVFTEHGAVRRIIALSPCHHIYGFLFSALLPSLLDVPVIRGMQAFALVQGRRVEAGDVVIGFPFVWKQVSRSQQPFAPGVIGVTSTGPSDKAVVLALMQQGLSQHIEIYGSSETSGLGFRRHPDEPFELLPRWQRLDERPDTLLDARTQTQYPLSDHIAWQTARMFVPQGRRDHAVQVAGINVFPDSVAEKLRQLPYVQSVAVRLMLPAEGDRLKAFVVPADATIRPDDLRQQLQAWCQRHLSAAECPQAFTFGVELPRNALGKASDWSIINEEHP